MLICVLLLLLNCFEYCTHWLPLPFVPPSENF